MPGGTSSVTRAGGRAEDGREDDDDDEVEEEEGCERGRPPPAATAAEGDGLEDSFSSALLSPPCRAKSLVMSVSKASGLQT